MGNAKGTAIINAVKALRMQRDEARKVLPVHVHRYLEERILASGWYPEEDYLEIIRALGKLLPDTGIDPFEYMGRVQALTDLGGIYAHLLRQGDPETTMRRTAVTWSHYHDTGKEQVIDSGEGYVVLEFSGYESPARETCRVMKGWIYQKITLAGGKDTFVEHTQCVLDGAPTCRFRAIWKKQDQTASSPAPTAPTPKNGSA